MKPLRVIALLYLFLQLSITAIVACPLHGLPQSEHVKNPSNKQDPEPNLDGVVEVSFKIDNLGRVQILNINSTSPQLADYVIKKLSNIQLQQGNSQVGKIIKYRFVFKKQA